MASLMKRFLLTFLLAIATQRAPLAQEITEPIRVGIIGLDTSHAPAFTKAMNALEPKAGERPVRVVAAYPKGSPDIESSVRRVPRYTKELEDLGVAIVSSIDALLERVDAVLLETNDGRPHLEQALPVMRKGLPLFVDKPMAADLQDVVALFLAAKRLGVPLFSSSSLRFSGRALALRGGAEGNVLGCDAFSPATLEATHPDLYWYGIHGVEILYTVMGTGCVEVTRAHTPSGDLVTGRWNDGRLGTFRGLRQGKTGYGATVFTEKRITSVGDYEGYGRLVEAIASFLHTEVPPVDAEETIELYAFMTAADVSKQRGGVPVPLASVLEPARKAAEEKLRVLAVR